MNAQPTVERGGERADWREEALCAEVDPELWFPEPGFDSPAAKQICGRCPVQAECLDFALASNEQFGVWGGLSARQRRDLRPSRVAASLGEVA